MSSQQEMIDRIIEFSQQFNPVSTFLYGSQASGEATPGRDSDYEVGLVFDDDKYVSRREIKSKQDFTNVSIYPFRLGELKNYSLNTPFPKKLFVLQLAKIAKTIAGDDVISRVNLPKISKSDLIGMVEFELGVAFCSFLIMRRGDNFLANDEFSKSCLFGLQAFIMDQQGIFLTKYQEIYDYSKNLDLPDKYRAVIDAAYNFRQGEDEIDQNLIYENMSFLNHILQEILAAK
ncbi:nucleotidyltransferase domain-containing protein [Candidatus Saccharibacteria bacterium]|nr:nucleotidyltransferase domain-containing protein [Candidatus Saccharibacteria bacterium]